MVTSLGRNDHGSLVNWWVCPKIGYLFIQWFPLIFPLKEVNKWGYTPRFWRAARSRCSCLVTRRGYLLGRAGTRRATAHPTSAHFVGPENATFQWEQFFSPHLKNCHRCPFPIGWLIMLINRGLCLPQININKPHAPHPHARCWPSTRLPAPTRRRSARKSSDRPLCGCGCR